jgi:cytidylate kinase
MQVIAIDGPAGAGKSSLARRVAEDLGWAYLDTGAMYRAVTLVALERGVPLSDAASLAAMAEGLDLWLAPDGRVRVGGEDVTDRIRSAQVTARVSEVASVPEVRGVMAAHQRRFGAQNERIVAEGRDIGTVVFPDAIVKVYLDAEPEERARRRTAQEGDAEGEAPGGVAETLARIEERDRKDRSRAVAPLRPATDAWRLDTTGMTLDEVFAAVRSHVRSRIPVDPRRGNPP